jgi:hypothetical protein
VGEPDPTWHVDGELALISGLPGQHLWTSNVGGPGNTSPEVLYDEQTDSLYLIQKGGGKFMFHVFEPDTGRKINYFEKNDFYGTDADARDLVVSGDHIIGKVESDSRKVAVFYKSTFLGQNTVQWAMNGYFATLDFSDKQYTASDGSTVDLTGGGIHLEPVGMRNGDIWIFVRDDDKNYPGALFSTDKITNTIKNKFPKMKDVDWCGGWPKEAKFGPGDCVLVRGGTADEDYAICYPYTNLIRYNLNGADVPLDVIVSDIFERSGISSSYYDVTELMGDSVTGFAINKQMEAKSALQPLMRAFQFDVVESDWTLMCRKRGNASPIDIPTEDLGAAEEGSDPSNRLVTTRTIERSLPQELVVQYQDPSLDYQVNAQRASRETTNSTNKKTMRLPLVLNAHQALQIAESMFQTMWVEQHSHQFTTDSSYFDRIPGDVVNVEGHRILIKETTYRFPGLIEFSGVREQVTAYQSEAQAEEPQFSKQSLPTNPMTGSVLMELPLLSTQLGNPTGFFVAAFGLRDGWKGANIFRSTDDGVNWNLLSSIFSEAVVGLTTEALPSGTTTRWDMINSLNIRIRTSGAALQSTNEYNALDGENTLAVGDDGRWEILSFVDAVQESDGTFTISTFIRGRRGTEHNIGNHKVDDKVVLLSKNSLDWIPVETEKLGSTIQYKIVSVNKNMGSVPAKSFACQGLPVKPYSPVHIQGRRNDSGDLTITWFRRSRIASSWLSSDVPLAEDTESYEVDILDGSGNVVRTLSTSGEDSDQAGVTYTATQQNDDFGSLQSSVDVVVYQTNNIVGRGYPGESTV